jgi:hypothetical protein
LRVFPHSPDEMKTALSGQSDVGDYQIGPLLASDCQTVLRFGRGADGVAFQPKQLGKRMQCIKIVFYDKDRPHDARVLSS